MLFSITASFRRRPEYRLLMKFTISTITHQHVRISSVDLQPSESDGKKLKVMKSSKAPTLLVCLLFPYSSLLSNHVFRQ